MIWEHSHTVNAQNVTMQQVWHVWAQVGHWPQWDHDLLRCELLGDFVAGTKVKIKPKKGPQVLGEITKCVPNKLFTVQTSFPLGTKAIFEHEVAPYLDGIKVTHKASIKGPLTFIFKYIMGASIKKGLPAVMSKMIELASLHNVND